MSHELTKRGRIHSATRNLFICLVAIAVLLLVLPAAHAAEGSYTLGFRAGDPGSYVNVPPSVLPCPSGGRGVSPMVGSNYPGGVESLAPGILGLGQIIPFEVKVANPGDEDILVNLKFEDANGGFGFDPSYGVHCAFVDTADPESAGLTGNEKASIVSTTIGSNGIDGTIKIEGLAAGKTVVVQIWMVLDDSLPPNVSGTVQSKIESAQTVSGIKINAGTETCSMSKLDQFVSNEADISIQKLDTPDPVALFGNITYTIEAHNNSANTFANGVVITDTLDSNTSFVSVSVNDPLGYPTTCQHAAGIVTCDVGWLDVHETVTVTITASVNKGTPWGAGGDTCTESSPICNNVSITSINSDLTGVRGNDDSDSQPTGVEEYGPFGGLVLNKEPDQPVVRAGTLVTYSYEVTNPGTYPVYDVMVTDDKCKPGEPLSLESGDTDSDSQLDPDELWVFTCESTLLEDTTNKGTVTGKDWVTDIPLETSNTAVVDVINPEIELKKTSEAPTVTTGGIANYTYVVTNIGDDPIQDVTVDDDKCEQVVLASGDTNENSKLDLEEVWTFTCSQALFIDTTNTAQAQGKDSLPKIVLSNTSTVTVTIDDCPSDPAKTAPGLCGCGVVDVDSDGDGDGTLDCNDGCPEDANKTEPGVCGCNVEDTDTDGDGIFDCVDVCPNDTNNGDSDGDGTPDCNEECDSDPAKTEPGICGCGIADTDTDGDGTADCNEACDEDPNKVAAGVCGCGIADTDTDGDGTADCNETCDEDANKVAEGVCGCGVPDVDSDGDGKLDCQDECPNNAVKTAAGSCGCDFAKAEPGICGCGEPDEDLDGNGVVDCIDRQCRNVDVTVDRAAIDIGPEQLAVYGRAAFKKLVQNTRKVDKALSKRLSKSGKRLEPKMQLQIKLANQQLDQLPNIIRVCPESEVCKSVDNTQKLIQYQNAVRKLSGIVLRTLNRGTRLAAKSVKNIQRKTRPFGKGVKTTTKDLLVRAAKIPPVQSFCAS